MLSKIAVSKEKKRLSLTKKFPHFFFSFLKLSLKINTPPLQYWELKLYWKVVRWKMKIRSPARDAGSMVTEMWSQGEQGALEKLGKPGKPEPVFLPR